MTADIVVTLNNDIVVASTPVVVGPTGATGAAGTNGTNGLGVPSGGTTGQELVKLSNTSNDTAWVDRPMMDVKEFGVVGNGVADDTIALQNALNAAASAGRRLFARGTFKITNTVYIKGPIDFEQATFNYAGAASITAVVVGDTSSTGLVNPGKIVLPKVINTNKSANGWAQSGVVGTVGVRVQRLYSEFITVPRIEKFETGLLLYGDTYGVSYVQFTLGTLVNNKVNLKFDTDGTGWVNQNQFISGRLQHTSNEGVTPQTGVKNIYMTRSAGPNSAPNNNTFLGVSIESPNTVEYNIDLDKGSYNHFIDSRFEVTGSNGRVRWGSEALYNRIECGYQVSDIVETIISGAIGNEIVGNFIEKRYFQGPDPVNWENGSSSSNSVLTIMRAGGQAAGDNPATAYLGKFAAAFWKQKAAHTDAWERFKVSAGALFFGNGTTDPVVKLYGNTNSLLLNGTAEFKTDLDSVTDLGNNTLRWKGLKLSGGIATGIRTLTSNTSLGGSTDSTVLCNSATAFTVTLPSAVTYVGNQYRLKNIGSALVTIAATAGVVDQTSLYPGETLDIQSNGTDWKRSSVRGIIYFDVDNYGAVGDGTTDDQAAVQKAITAAANVGIVRFRRGATYLFQSVLTIPSNTELDLNTATLKVGASLGSSVRLVLVSGVSNVIIRDGIIDGDKASYAPVTEQRHNIHIIDSTKVELRNLTTKNAKGDGIYIGGVTTTPSDIRINQVISDGNHRQGMSVIQSNGLFVSRSVFRNTTGTAPQAGVDLEPNNDTDVLTNIKFESCDFSGNSGAGLLFALRATPSALQEGFDFIGCTFNSNGKGIEISNGRDIRIVGGSINTNTTYGVVFDSSSITNNVFLNEMDIKKNGSEGIRISSTATSTTISNSSIESNSQTSTGTLPGINVATTTSCVNLKVVGCTFTGTSQTYGITTNANTSLLTLLGNIYTSFLTGATALSDDKATRTTVDSATGGIGSNVFSTKIQSFMGYVSTIFGARNATDTNDRFSIKNDGMVEWGPGSGALDISLTRSAANVLGLGANDALKTGASVTGSRPSASTYGQGAQFFDTTLNKPIWSNGTIWLDASGAAV